MENFKQIFDEVLIESLGIKPEQIVGTASFKDDLGADSLEMVEVIMEFEKKFNITIPDEKAEEIKTVAEAENYLRQRLEVPQTK